MTCSWKKGKPIRFESEKTRTSRVQTRDEWFELNPPDEYGFWYCYISKHPNCPQSLTRETLTLEHNLAKVRRPDLKFDVTNLYPACTWDNGAKGSLSAEEYMNA